MVARLLTKVLLLASFAVPRGTNAAAVHAPTAAQPTLLDITVELKVNGKAEAVTPSHVFKTGDTIRMRLKSHVAAYLYVMNQGSSGKFETVFPAAETGSDNRVRTDGEYLVPAVDDGWFEVQGPPGFDVLYFLLSPTELAKPAVQNFTAPASPGSLKPRCNDKVFKARGECVDDSAGPAALPEGKALPPALVPMAGSASRDILFKKQSDGTVSVAGASSAPVIYTFRLAHQ